VRHKKAQNLKHHALSVDYCTPNYVSILMPSMNQKPKFLAVQSDQSQKRPRVQWHEKKEIFY